MNKTLIFNIQKFSVHDGPGIRTTVFFMGCPLKCVWCHNPESQKNHKTFLYNKEKCSLCRTCQTICKTGAIEFINNKIQFDISKCNFCNNCCIYCVNEAREIAGKEYTVDEVFKEVIKDEIFYEQSNGGVTLSGGEPLLHIDFIEELLCKLKEKNIHTAVDTCGAVNFETLKRISKYTDLFLYDLKVMDEDLHIKYTGSSNKNIIINLLKLSHIHNNINIRLPIIEGINADINHIEQVIKLISNLNINKINLLPYHDIAKHKYKKLGLNYNESMAKPSDEKLNLFKDTFIEKGFNVKIGG